MRTEIINIEVCVDIFGFRRYITAGLGCDRNYRNLKHIVIENCGNNETLTGCIFGACYIRFSVTPSDELIT